MMWNEVLFEIHFRIIYGPYKIMLRLLRKIKLISEMPGLLMALVGDFRKLRISGTGLEWIQWIKLHIDSRCWLVNKNDLLKLICLMPKFYNNLASSIVEWLAASYLSRPWKLGLMYMPNTRALSAGYRLALPLSGRVLRLGRDAQGYYTVLLHFYVFYVVLLFCPLSIFKADIIKGYVTSFFLKKES